MNSRMTASLWRLPPLKNIPLASGMCDTKPAPSEKIRDRVHRYGVDQIGASAAPATAQSRRAVSRQPRQHRQARIVFRRHLAPTASASCALIRPRTQRCAVVVCCDILKVSPNCIELTLIYINGTERKLRAVLVVEQRINHRRHRQHFSGRRRDARSFFPRRNDPLLFEIWVRQFEQWLDRVSTEDSHRSRCCHAPRRN